MEDRISEMLPEILNWRREVQQVWRAAIQSDPADN